MSKVMQVIILAAVTENGLIAESENQRSTTWTSDEDRQFFVDNVKKSDALIIGNTTFKTMRRFPRGSSWWVYTSKPEEFENPKPEIINAQATNKSPLDLVEELKAAGKQTVLICGGSSIYAQFANSGVVNKMYLTVEPVRFAQGIPLFSESLIRDFRLVSTQKLSEQSIVYEYENSN